MEFKKTSNDGLERKLDIGSKSMNRKLDLKKLSGMHNRQRGKKYERQVKQHGGQGEMSNICLSGILEWKVTEWKRSNFEEIMQNISELMKHTCILQVQEAQWI